MADLGFAQVDTHRALRKGFPEVIFGAGKTSEQVVKIADKLFKLATELKGYVDKSNENVLSLDVLKKAEEIEKLAHSVKEKMKGPN